MPAIARPEITRPTCSIAHKGAPAGRTLILRVRGADASIKPAASTPGSGKESDKAREAGDSRIIPTNVKRYGYHRFAGSMDILLLDLALTPQALCWRPLRGLKTRSTRILFVANPNHKGFNALRASFFFRFV